jgi:hypothetical protein
LGLGTEATQTDLEVRLRISEHEQNATESARIQPSCDTRLRKVWLREGRHIAKSEVS